jgi:hypothetical protein
MKLLVILAITAGWFAAPAFAGPTDANQTTNPTRIEGIPTSSAQQNSRSQVRLRTSVMTRKRALAVILRIATRTAWAETRRDGAGEEDVAGRLSGYFFVM